MGYRKYHDAHPMTPHPERSNLMFNGSFVALVTPFTDQDRLDVAALDALRFDPRALSLLYAVHLFGGAAMGASRAQGFCDESGRAFDVTGLYVTDAAALPSNTGANPQITIMANALRIAEGIIAARGEHRSDRESAR